jgi:hypothetical protein
MPKHISQRRERGHQACAAGQMLQLFRCKQELQNNCIGIKPSLSGEDAAIKRVLQDKRYTVSRPVKYLVPVFLD